MKDGNAGLLQIKMVLRVQFDSAAVRLHEVKNRNFRDAERQFKEQEVVLKLTG